MGAASLDHVQLRGGLLAMMLGQLLMACTTESRSASDVREIAARTSCSTCTIELERAGVLAIDSSLPRLDASGRSCLLARASSGEILFGGAIAGDGIEVYDAEGHWLRRIGRRGAGPGEFGPMVRLLLTPEDSILVIDDTNIRVQVLSPSGQYVRSWNAPARYQSVALTQRRTLMFYRPPQRLSDPTFLELDMNGTELAAFGRPAGRLDVEAGFVSGSSDGGAWYGRYWEFTIQRHPPECCESGSRFKLELDWFPPNEPYPEHPFRAAQPPAALYDVREDSSGYLWTFTAAPDPAWKAGTAPDMTPEWYRRTFDTIVLVLDVERSAVLATKRFDHRFSLTCAGDLLYRIDESASGEPRLEMYRLRLSDQLGTQGQGTSAGTLPHRTP